MHKLGEVAQSHWACPQVMQTLSGEQREELTPLKLRRKARDFALKTVNSQRAGFKRCAACSIFLP